MLLLLLLLLLGVAEGEVEFATWMLRVADGCESIFGAAIGNGLCSHTVVAGAIFVEDSGGGRGAGSGKEAGGASRANPQLFLDQEAWKSNRFAVPKLSVGHRECAKKKDKERQRTTKSVDMLPPEFNFFAQCGNGGHCAHIEMALRKNNREKNTRMG